MPSKFYLMGGRQGAMCSSLYLTSDNYPRLWSSARLRLGQLEILECILRILEMHDLGNLLTYFETLCLELNP